MKTLIEYLDARLVELDKELSEEHIKEDNLHKENYGLSVLYEIEAETSARKIFGLMSQIYELRLLKDTVKEGKIK